MILKAIRLHIAFSLLLVLMVQGQSYAQVSTNKPTLKQLEAKAVYYDATRARLKGDVKEALVLLENVVRLDPEAGGAYYDMSGLSKQQQDLEGALEYIKKAVDIEPGNKWYKERYAELLIDKGLYEEAAQVYLSIANLESRNRVYYEVASQLYLKNGKYDDALKVLNDLSAKYEGDEDVLLRKQQVYLKMNDLDNAVKVADQLIAINPDEGKYYVQLAEMYANNDQPQKALELYKKAEKIFPEDATLQLSLSEYYRMNNNPAKHEEYLTKVMNNNAVTAEAKLAILGNYLQGAKDFQSISANAIAFAEIIVKQSPDNAMAISAYGDMLAQNGDAERASVQYKRSLEIDPSKYQVWQNLLFTYSGAEYADSLIKYSKKAIRLFPNQAILHYLSAIGHSNGKDYNKAANAAQRAIDLQSEDNTVLLADMYSLLADIYNSDKKYDLSDENFEMAIKLSPNNPTTLNNYSYYLSVRGVRLADAERMSKKSLDLSPDQATFMDTYGWILYKMGRYQEARKYVQQAIDANPQNADATLWEHLGDIDFKLKNIDAAVESWKKAKALGADDINTIDKKIRDKQLYE